MKKQITKTVLLALMLSCGGKSSQKSMMGRSSYKDNDPASQVGSLAITLASRGMNGGGMPPIPNFGSMGGMMGGGAMMPMPSFGSMGGMMGGGGMMPMANLGGGMGGGAAAMSMVGNMGGMAMSASNPTGAAMAGASSLLGAVDNICGFSESHKQESMRVQGREQRKTIAKQGEENRKTIETQGQEQRKTLRVAGDEKRKTVREVGKEQRLTQDNAQTHRMSFLNRSAKHKKDIISLQSKEQNKTIRLQHSNQMQVLQTGRKTMQIDHSEQRSTISLRHSHSMQHMREDTLNRKDIIRYQTEHERNNLFLRKQNEIELSRIKTQQQQQLRRQDHDLLMQRDKAQTQSQEWLSQNQHKRSLELSDHDQQHQVDLSKLNHQQGIEQMLLSLEQKHHHDQELHNLRMQQLYQEHNQHKDLAKINHQLSLQRDQIQHHNNLEIKKHDADMQTKQHIHESQVLETQHQNKLEQIQEEHKEQRQTDTLRSQQQIDLEEKKFRQKLFFNNLDALKTNLPELDINPLLERQTIIQQVAQKLGLDQKEVEWAHPNSKVSLHGYPGIGKTTLAMIFGHQYFDNPYDMVWWLDCLREDTINTSLRQIGWQLGMQEALKADIQNVIFYINLKISQQKNKWLVIWDNVDDLSLYKKYKHMNLYPNIGGHILLTSRNFTCPNPITIPSLSTEETIQLISQIKQPNHQRDQANMHTLAHASLKGHPLAVAQSGQHMSDSIMSYTDYSAFKRDAPHRLSKSERPNRYYNRNTTLINEIEKALSTLEQTNAESRKLINAIAIFDSNNIPIYLLKRCMDDEYATYQYISELRRLGLITQGQGETISTHPTFRDMLYDRMHINDRIKNAAYLTHILCGLLTQDTLPDLAPHIYATWQTVITLNNHSKQTEPLHDTSITLLKKSLSQLMPIMTQIANYYLLRMSNKNAYINIISSALEVGESEKEFDSCLPQLYNYKAHYHLVQGDINETKELYQKLYDYVKSTERVDDKTLNLPLSIYEYGLILFKNQDYEEAKIRLEELLESEDNLDNFIILNTKILLGKIAYLYNNLKETIDILDKALTLASSQNDNPSSAICHHLIGKAYYQIYKSTSLSSGGDTYLDLGQKHQEKALRYFFKINDNMGIASANAALGFIYFSKGEVETSTQYFENAWQLYYNAQGLENENTGLVWEYLINCYDTIAIKNGISIIDVAVMRGKETILQKLLLEESPIDNNLTYKEVIGLYLQSSHQSHYLTRNIVEEIVLPRTLSYMIQQYIGQNEVTQNTRTPYFYASSPMIVQILHYNDVNINQPDEHGISPYLYHKSRNSDIIATLDSLGAQHWCSGSKKTYRYEGIEGKVKSLDISTKGHLAALDNKHNITVWDRDSRKVLFTSKTKSKEQNALKYSPTGTKLVIAGSHISLFSIDQDYDFEKIKIPATCLSFISDNIIAIGTKDHKGILLYDMHKEKEISKLDIDQDTRDILYDQGNNIIFAGSNEGKLMLWDHKTSKIIHNSKPHNDRINKIARSTTKNIFATASDDAYVKIWDIRNLKKTQSFENDELECAVDISFSHRDANALAIAYFRKYVQFWDVTTVSQIQIESLEDAHLSSLIFCPDTNLLFMGSEGVVKAWDTPKFIG